MTAVNATFTTSDQTFPDGTVAAGYLLTLTETTTGAVLTGTAPLGATSLSIVDVPPGTYAGTIALVDAANAPVAPAVASAEPVVVAAPATVTLAVPASLTLAV